MSWSTISENDRDLFAARNAVRVAVRRRRDRGLKNEHAIEDVSGAFRLSPRQVRAWLYDEVIEAPRQKCRLIVRRLWADMDREVERMRLAAEQLELETERDRIAEMQYELPLEKPKHDRASQGLVGATRDEMAALAGELDKAARHAAAYRAVRRKTAT